MIRIKTFILTAIIFLSFFSISLTGKTQKFSIVTSIPVETDLNRNITPQTADIWMNLIKNANRSIDMAFFYMISKRGEILDPIVNQLEKASDRGVKIRILTDRKMQNISLELIKRLKKHKNIRVVIFNWKKLTGGVLHAKYFIVDKKTAFLGSQNFDWRSLKHIHETGVMINDCSIIKKLQKIFDLDWKYNTGKIKHPIRNNYQGKRSFPKNIKVLLTSSPEQFNPPGIPGSLDTMVNLINSAKKTITIQLLDYKTSVWGSKKKFSDLDNALLSAAERGVMIKLLVSDWNLRKPGVFSLKRLAGKKNITVKFVVIPVSKEGFIPYARVVHSKVMRIDKKILMIGTSNWGRDYFFRSRNVEIFIKSRKLSKILDKLFNDLWNSGYSNKIIPGKHYKPPRIK